MSSPLLSDRLVQVALCLVTAVAIVVLVPVLPDAWLDFYSNQILDLPFLILAVVAMLYGLKSVDDDAERRFWRLAAAGVGCQALVALPFAVLNGLGRWTFGWSIYADIVYVVGYAFILLAIETRPHGRTSSLLARRERQLRGLGIVVFLTFVVAYFIVAPAATTVEAYEAGGPSYYLYLVLDTTVVVRLIMSRADAWSVRWTSIYAWLAGAALLTLVGDAIEFLAFASGTTLASGTMLDLVWLGSPLLIVIAARLRHQPFAAEHRVLNEPSHGGTALRVGHLLLIAAVTLPTLHGIIELSGTMDPRTEDAREMIEILSLLTLGAFALDAYRVLEKDREQMEARELHLAGEIGVTRKMDAVARLAASVAHDFNNLIHIVQGRTDIIADQLPEEDPLQEEVREINAASARAADLASQLMAFGRAQPMSPATVSLHEMVKRAEQLLKPLLDERTLLRLRLSATDEVVRIDPLQFERVILNLVTNARDAMPSGGTITIETFNPSLDGLPNEPYTDSSIVRIAVSDTGHGMEPATVAHIFEPFFTTKEGRGAGLGLAITHGLLQQAGGSITVDSELGKGTRFLITLPVVRNEAPSPVSLRQTTPTIGAVLIIEMDATNRQLLRRLLVDLDRPVLTAATGPEALLVADRYPGPIDLAVVDVTCEGGRSIASQLRERLPAMHALLLAQDQPIEPTPLDVLLREPFELSDVLKAAKALTKAQ